MGSHVVTFHVDVEQYNRILDSAIELGVTVEQFVAEAVDEECYLTLGDGLE